jgi:hypothetical protein
VLGRDAERDAAESDADALGLVNRDHLPNRVRPTRGLAEIYSGIPFTQHGKDVAKDGELVN